MKKLLSLFLVIAVASVFAEAPKKISVFVINRTNVQGMEQAMDAVRDQLVASLAEVEGFAIMDTTMAAEQFKT